jgi:uncharacterized protein YcbX
MKVASLHIYPVKSVRSIDVAEAELTARGLVHDRRWLVVNPEGRFMTQRELPRMALIEGVPSDEGLRLVAPEMPNLFVSTPPHAAPKMQVSVWESNLAVPRAGDAADAWLTQFLSTPLHLVHLPDAITRPCTSSLAAPGDEVSFADTFAVLVTTTASLADLCQRAGVNIPMNRFRSNIVVDGAEAWAEDSWGRLKIGEVEVECIKPCARCKITTTDQLSAEVGREPLATLRKFRFWPEKKGIIFGMNASPRMLGNIKVGDRVGVLTTRRPPVFQTIDKLG